MTKPALIKGARSDEWCVSQIFEYYKHKGKILLPWDTDKSNFKEQRIEVE